jgi:hypothetical protein
MSTGESEQKRSNQIPGRMNQKHRLTVARGIRCHSTFSPSSSSSFIMVHGSVHGSFIIIAIFQFTVPQYCTFIPFTVARALAKKYFVSAANFPISCIGRYF